MNRLWKRELSSYAVKSATFSYYRYDFQQLRWNYFSEFHSSLCTSFSQYDIMCMWTVSLKHDSKGAIFVSFQGSTAAPSFLLHSQLCSCGGKKVSINVFI